MRERVARCGLDLVAIGEASTWTPRRCRRRGVVADAEEEQAHGMNLAVIGEAVGEALTWTRWRLGRQSAVGEDSTFVETWGGRGAGGRAGGGEMVPIGLGFKGQPYD
jgi:hypothetical protein